MLNFHLSNNVVVIVNGCLQPYVIVSKNYSGWVCTLTTYSDSFLNEALHTLETPSFRELCHAPVRSDLNRTVDANSAPI